MRFATPIETEKKRRVPDPFIFFIQTYQQNINRKQLPLGTALPPDKTELGTGRSPTHENAEWLGLLPGQGKPWDRDLSHGKFSAASCCSAELHPSAQQKLQAKSCSL